MPRRMSLVVVAFTLVATLAIMPSSHPLQAVPTFQVVASGLENPRGLAFGPGGALYVAEAGHGGAGPCFLNSEPRYVCYGPTAAITRVFPSVAGSQVRVVDGLPSLAPPPGGPGEGTGATGAHDIGFLGLGNGWITVGLGADPSRRGELGEAGALFGRMYRFTPGHPAIPVDDLAAFEGQANPDGLAPDSNPYGLAVLPGKRVYTDAGGNTLNEVRANGTIVNLAVFPNRLVPFGPPGNQIPMQAVPTTVTRGPDGALYVGQLTGFPFPVGGANVYRVAAAGGSPTVAAGGFTNIIDLAFGPDGSMYVLEMFTNGILSGNPTGALTRIAPDGTRTQVASLGLVLPGGVAIGPDGYPYVTRFSTSPGAGDVVRIIP